jgi:hypothetical protein
MTSFCAADYSSHCSYCSSSRVPRKASGYFAWGCFALVLVLLSVSAAQAAPLPSDHGSAPSVSAPAEHVVWNEDWESSPDDRWSAEAGTWEMGMPASGPEEAFLGQNVAATVLDGNYGGSVDSRLVRIESFTVPNASETPRLRFWHWFSFASGDRGEVQIRPEGGSWETISEEPVPA